jgi:hypothetical protein
MKYMFPFLQFAIIAFDVHVGIKNSMPHSFLEDAARNGSRFAEYCNVERVLLKNNKAVGVVGTIYNKYTKQTYKLTVKAKKAVIVSCGAINTPALLLRSKVPNGNGFIGQNLRLHPVVASVGIMPYPIKVWEGAPMTAVSLAGAAGTDGSHYGVRLEAPSVHAGFCSAQIPWTSASQFKYDMLQVQNAFSLISLCRDKGSGSVCLDSNGNARIYYPLHEHDSKQLCVGAEMLARVSAAAGCESLICSSLANEPFFLLSSQNNIQGKSLKKDDITEYIDERQSNVNSFIKKIKTAGVYGDFRSNVFSAHQMGTAKMSASPQDGVCKDTGELWAVKDLYVADASLFPTPSGSNPMITVLSLVYDCAQRLESKLKSQSHHIHSKL